MTPFHWALLAVFVTLWLGSGVAVAWSVWVMLTWGDTTSRRVSRLPLAAVALFCLLTGVCVGFVAGHLWWPIHAP